MTVHLTAKIIKKEREKMIEAYENKKGEIAKVNRSDLYAEIDNRWDKEFNSEKELNDWIKSEKFEFVGMD